MKRILIVLVVLLGVVAPTTAQELTAKQIIEKAEEKFRGKKSMYAEMTIISVRPKYKRERTMKSWSKGDNRSLMLITSPAKEKGIAYLKRDKEVWNWMPTIERTIKLPPSMMLQNWMGTDLTNDDLLRESSTVNDYHQKVIGSTKIGERDCWKIKLTPKPDAPVVWGKVIVSIDKKDYIQLRAEYYDEDGYLINVMKASDIKMLGGYKIASRMEVIPMEKKGNKTVMIFNKIQFDIHIEDSFFSTKNMKTVK